MITEELKQQWREEFESKFKEWFPGVSWDYDEKDGYDSTTVDCFWQGYLAAKEADYVEMEEIKGQFYNANVRYVQAREEIKKLNDEIERLKFNIEDHACSTGDCPHEKQHECDEELRRIVNTRDGAMSIAHKEISKRDELIREALTLVDRYMDKTNSSSAWDTCCMFKEKARAMIGEKR